MNAKTVAAVDAVVSYVAYLSVAPVSSRMRGVPVTTTSSSNVTSMRMLSPRPYVLLAACVETVVTSGGSVSVAISLVRPSEPGSPGAATLVQFTRLSPASLTSPSRALVAL